MFHRCFFYTLVEPYLNEVHIRENITAANAVRTGGFFYVNPHNRPPTPR